MEIASITMMFIRFWIVLVGCHLFCRPLGLQHVELVHLAAWLLLNSLARTQRKAIGPGQADSPSPCSDSVLNLDRIRRRQVPTPTSCCSSSRAPSFAVFIHAMIFFVLWWADFLVSLVVHNCAWACGQMIYLFCENVGKFYCTSCESLK
jgi:hypothetical protein